MKPLFFYTALAASLALSAPAFAYSECTGKVSRLYIDNTGYIWIEMIGGGSSEIPATNPNKITYYSALLSAKLSNASVTFRYAKDVTTCSAVNSDLMALWIG